MDQIALSFANARQFMGSVLVARGNELLFDKITVAMSNFNSSAPDEMLFKLGAVAHGQAVVLTSERKAITLPTASLSAYAGSYDFGDVKATVTVEDGHLMWQDGPLVKAQLFAESATRFFLKVVDAQIEFAKDGAGAITGLTLHLPHGDLTAARK